jgi:hypothetical protein
MEDFDWNIYKKLNIDLQKFGVHTKDDFENHWLLFGKNEGRKCSINLYKEYPNFNWLEYKNLNPDLETANIITKKQLEDHFIEYGRVENRSYYITKKEEIKSNNILFFTKKTKTNIDAISIHLLLPTVGRNTIFNMLNSIKGQLDVNDYITIVYDGLLNADNVLELKDYIKDWNCNINIYIEINNLGFWGHAIRNLYKDLNGTFVLHIDDDDILEKNCIATVKSTCINTKYSYIFCIKKNNKIYWEYPEIKQGNIGTPCGIISIETNKQCSWGLCYGGDYDYYCCVKNLSKITFIQKVIYIVNHSIYRDIDRIYCYHNDNSIFIKDCIDNQVDIDNIIKLDIITDDKIKTLQTLNRIINFSININYKKILIVFKDIELKTINISKTNENNKYIYINNTDDMCVKLQNNIDELVKLLKVR